MKVLKAWLLYLLVFCMPLIAAGQDDVPLQLTEDQKTAICKENIASLAIVLAAHEYALSKVKGEKTVITELNLDELVENSSLLESKPVCPSGGEYSLDENRNIICSFHIPEEKIVDPEKECQLCRNALGMALEMYDMNSGDFSLEPGGERALPECMDDLVEKGCLKSEIECPGGGEFTFSVEDGAYVVECSEHGR